MRTERANALEWVTDRNLMSEFGSAMDLYFGGDMNAALALSGQVMGRIEEVRPVQDILDSMVVEFSAAVAALHDRYGR